MQSLTIVGLLDERPDRLAGMFQIAIISTVDLLLLECLHEALRMGVVVRVADAAHARLDAVRVQQDRVFANRHIARRNRSDGSGCQELAGAPRLPSSGPQWRDPHADGCPRPSRYT